MGKTARMCPGLFIRRPHHISYPIIHCLHVFMEYKSPFSRVTTQGCHISTAPPLYYSTISDCQNGIPTLQTILTAMPTHSPPSTFHQCVDVPVTISWSPLSWNSLRFQSDFILRLVN